MSSIDRAQIDEEQSRRCHRTCSRVLFYTTGLCFFTAALMQIPALRAVVCAAAVREIPSLIELL